MWEKKKLLVTSNFFFFHNVFKSCLLLMRQNEYLWSTGLRHSFFNLPSLSIQIWGNFNHLSFILNLSKTTNFRLFLTKRNCSQRFQISCKWWKVFQIGGKHWEKEKLLITSNISFSHSVLNLYSTDTHFNASTTYSF